MKLILIPLLFLVLIAFSVQMINFVPVSTTYQGTSNNPDTSNSTQINDLGIVNTTFNITIMTGFLALFTAIIAVGVLTGLNISVFGSTVQLSLRSQKLVFVSMFYGGLWGLFSTLATVGLNGVGLFSIPTWGILFYLILTLFYIIGIDKLIEAPST